MISEKRFTAIVKEVMGEYLPKVPKYERAEFIKALAEEFVWEGIIEQEGVDVEESDEEDTGELEF